MKKRKYKSHCDRDYGSGKPEIDRIWTEWQAANPGQNPNLVGRSNSCVFTLDSDFNLYRKNGRQVIPTIMTGN